MDLKGLLVRIKSSKKIIFLALVLLIGLLLTPTLFFAAIIILSDLLVAFISVRTKIPSPFDLIMVGIIIASYSYHVNYAILISIGYLINGLILADIDISHFITFPIFIGLSFLIVQLRFLPISAIALMIPIAKFLLQCNFEYLVLRQMDSNKIIHRLFKLFTAYVFVMFFYNFLV
jgi:hypothetical protein